MTPEVIPLDPLALEFVPGMSVEVKATMEHVTKYINVLDPLATEFLPVASQHVGAHPETNIVLNPRAKEFKPGCKWAALDGGLYSSTA